MPLSTQAPVNSTKKISRLALPIARIHGRPSHNARPAGGDQDDRGKQIAPAAARQQLHSDSSRISPNPANSDIARQLPGMPRPGVSITAWPTW